MGYILANGASLFDKKKVLMTQSYGPESRGGACRSDVIISREEIDYPKIDRPDCLVAFSFDAYTNYDDIRDGGILLFDDGLFTIPKSIRKTNISYFGIPATEAALELGNPLTANMVMLGVLQQVTRAVSPEALKKAIKKRFPRFVEINLKAFKKGVSYALEKI
jgi:2-oxoglutarate ferredoxin oxidoreductase subunit gamma